DQVAAIAASELQNAAPIDRPRGHPVEQGDRREAVGMGLRHREGAVDDLVVGGRRWCGHGEVYVVTLARRAVDHGDGSKPGIHRKPPETSCPTTRAKSVSPTSDGNAPCSLSWAKWSRTEVAPFDRATSAPIHAAARA